jgi:hypothetical protein
VKIWKLLEENKSVQNPLLIAAFNSIKKDRENKHSVKLLKKTMAVMEEKKKEVQKKREEAQELMDAEMRHVGK